MAETKNDLVYAIVSSETELSLCLLLNAELGIYLSLADDIAISQKSGTSHFKRYFYEHEDVAEKYILLVNRNAGSVLFKDFKKVDYFFIIISEANTYGVIEKMESLKNNHSLTAIYKIDPVTIKTYTKIRDY